MAYLVWDQIFAPTGINTRILKAQFGSVLVRDYNGSATSMASYSPFDTLTGNLSSTILTTDGFYDTGYLDENGFQLDPKYTVDDLKGWQSRNILRSDITEDQTDFSFTLMQSTWLTDALEYQIPLASAQQQGEEGYTIKKSVTPNLTNRQVIAIGVDNSSGQAEYFGFGFPLARMTKPDKIDLSDKNPFQFSMGWTTYVCPFSAFPVVFWREGPAWRASGGNTSTLLAPVAAAASGHTATLTFAPPTSTNGPWTYAVTQNDTTTTVTTTVSSGNMTVTSSSPTSVVLTIAGLTATNAYTFSVSATGGNGSTSSPSPVSNSITAT